MLKRISSKSNKVIKQESLNLYSFELKKDIPCIEPRIPVEFEISVRAIELDNVGIDTVRERIDSGNLIFVARHRSRVVGYLFASTTRCVVREIEDELVVHKGEVYLYDAFTSKGFRGNRIYPALLAAACAHFKERGFRFALIFTRASNENSIKGIEKAGFSRFQVIQFMSTFGEKSWNYSSRNGDARSRFSNEN